jgi:hypothetical protein
MPSTFAARLALVAGFGAASLHSAAAWAQATPVPSMNTTSVGRIAGPYTPIPPGALGGDNAHTLLVANDLGMHCADLDARVASILPPFNVVHAQLIAKGAKPSILDSTTASLFFYGSLNPNDPVLSQTPVTGADGSIFKSNAGPEFLKTYTPLYPAGALAPYFAATNTMKGDLGLPVPDLERLYLGDGQLSLKQQTMPGVKSLVLNAQNVPQSIIDAPYRANRLQPVPTFEHDWPLFTNFPFGYAAQGVNWFSAEGIPMAPFDDVGRENPFPLMRFQARAVGTNKVLASTDTVVPVSGETNCKSCHLAAPDGNGLATGRLAKPVVPTSDPRYGHVPLWVSQEWASDLNTVALHDLMHKTTPYSGYNLKTGEAAKPVLCQTCHYSPALDLAQFGPQSGNGLDRAHHETMSRVMHYGHGILLVNGVRLFPAMPPPNDSRRMTPIGNPINLFTQKVLNATCYQCHPGKRTQCLRGTMYAKAGVVCQDCHGQMTQVGNDFSRNLPSGNFVVASDFYANPKTPRVPWANEPTCGSCHTGDAVSNMVGKPGTIAAPDNIRLIQAFLSTDSKATPILPTNLRFAEPRVASGAAAGNPKLYRLGIEGHGGVFCEGCHGSTHAEWPVLNPNGNDDMTATELQGHAGRIVECDTCHTGAMGANLNGPHGMHPVGNATKYSVQWVNAHSDYADRNGTAGCKTCHGVHGEGTPLARVAIARPALPCDGGALCRTEGTVTLAAGTQVACNLCHANPIR